LANGFGMMVARDGVEPPMPAFSGISRLKPVFNPQLSLSRWPQFCDHSVTSADVRLNLGNAHRETVEGRVGRALPTCSHHRVEVGVVYSSEAQRWQGRSRVDVCRNASLSPAFGIGITRRMSLCRLATADRRFCFVGRQGNHSTCFVGRCDCHPFAAHDVDSSW
jgi:hypothetical protein